MDLNELKILFYKFLGKFDENKINMIMNYLVLVVNDYEKNYDTFREYLKKQININLNPNKNIIHAFNNDDIFEADCHIPPKKPIETNGNLLDKANGNIFTMFQNLSKKSATALQPESIQISSNNQNSSFNSSSKNRIFFPKNIKKSLIETYKENKYPKNELIEVLILKTKLTKQQILQWFQSRRKNNKETKQTKHPMHIIDHLKMEYNKNNQPDKIEQERIASETKLIVKQVNSWFMHRRLLLNETNSFKHPEHITDYLVTKYELNIYPERVDMEKMANEIQITYKAVDSWFKQHRWKMKQTKQQPRLPKECVDYLRKAFEEKNNPTAAEIRDMALEIDLTAKQIRGWFDSKLRIIRRQRNKEKADLFDTTDEESEFESDYSNEYDSNEDISYSDDSSNESLNESIITDSDSSIISDDDEQSTDQENDRKKVDSSQLKFSKATAKPDDFKKYLIEKYKKNKLPTAAELDTMISETKLTKSQIKDWFKTRRCKLKETGRKHPQNTIDYLNKEYAKNVFPDKEREKLIALDINLTESQVHKWFSHRRTKLKDSKPFKFPKNVTELLLKKYDENRNPDSNSIEKIAAETQISAESVDRWFKSRRSLMKHSKTKNTFSKKDIDFLNIEFNKNNNPTSIDIEEMVSKTELSYQQVRTWLKGRRRRHGENNKK